MILPQSTYIKNHIIHDVIVHNCIHKCRSLSACFVMAAAKLGPGLSQVLRLTNSNSQDTERERELQSSTLSSSLLDSQILFLKKTQREKREETGLLLSEDPINFLQETHCNYRVLRILASALQQVRRRILFPLHTHGCNGWVRWNHSPLHMGGVCDKLLLI